MLNSQTNEVTYFRTEPHPEDEKRVAPLIGFIYDIPHIDTCGFLPPIHLLNEILESGGGDGGMGPGVKWESFSLNEIQYAQLCKNIYETDSKDLREYSRYWRNKLKTENKYQQIQSYEEWTDAICEEHLESYQLEIREMNFISLLKDFDNDIIESPEAWPIWAENAGEDYIEKLENTDVINIVKSFLEELYMYKEIENLNYSKYENKLRALCLSTLAKFTEH